MAKTPIDDWEQGDGVRQNGEHNGHSPTDVQMEVPVEPVIGGLQVYNGDNLEVPADRDAPKVDSEKRLAETFVLREAFPQGRHLLGLVLRREMKRHNQAMRMARVAALLDDAEPIMQATYEQVLGTHEDR